MHSRLISFWLIMLCHNIVSTSQVTVWMTLKNGVYYVPSVVNGIPLDFILDTGASDILISGPAVKSMLDAGVLTENDFVGVEHYQIANGDIEEGYIVNLRTLFIGGIELHDLKATLSLSLNAPLLLGISTLNRFGRAEVDFEIVCFASMIAVILKPLNQLFLLHNLDGIHHSKWLKKKFTLKNGGCDKY